MLQLAKEAGYKTFWLSNQFQDDGWISVLANQADESRFINYGAGRGENNVDGNLLPYFERTLTDKAPKKLIVLHLLGAHPSYDMRYPKSFSQFNNSDDKVAKKLSEIGRSSWTITARNEYDNAILYGDYVLGTAINILARRHNSEPAALLYASDHGQEVGHYRNHAGHSPKDKSGIEIPLIIWENNPSTRDANAKTALEMLPYQTDQLNHTILGLLKIKSQYYNDNDDLLSPQFTPNTRSMNGVAYNK